MGVGVYHLLLVFVLFLDRTCVISLSTYKYHVATQVAVLFALSLTPLACLRMSIVMANIATMSVYSQQNASLQHIDSRGIE